MYHNDLKEFSNNFTDEYALGSEIIPPALSSISNGVNRSTSIPLIEANNDFEAINCWLKSNSDNHHTLQSYRREVERLVLWAQSKGLSLSDLNKSHIEEYRFFLSNPQPKHQWISSTDSLNRRYILDLEKNVKIPNPSWRPFTKPLSHSSILTAMGVISSLYTYLVDNAYLSHHLVDIKKIKGKKNNRSCHRFLSQDAIDYLFSAIEKMPQETKNQQNIYERGRFLIRFLYYTAIRREECTHLKMSNVHIDNDGRWWLSVAGKGTRSENEAEDVPIPHRLQDDFKRYRSYFGLSGIPTSDEKDIPILFNVRIVGSYQAVSTVAVHTMVKFLFAFAAEQAKMSSETSRFADLYLKASAHWLRHSSATHQLDAHGDLAAVKDNLRHANIATTSIYLHKGKRERHDKTFR